ncbi:hypothetical protein [Microcoleus sp. MON2_D5]|uniref:hypothetical protein n=1 Tax=Microcoleus sp. MON2_D5 TaxID=2818833 RepID=UPI002FCE80A3
MNKCVSQKYLTLNRKIDLNFTFEQCAVQTVQSIPTIHNEESFEFGYLQLSIEFELKDYESWVDAPIFVRPKYLSLLGIISFLVSELFTVFKTAPFSTASADISLDELKVGQQNRLIIDDVDLTDNLNEFLDKLEKLKEHEKSFFFSLLDRWRKARYMEEESDESFLYEDEATLSYFHVLELLGDVYSKDLLMKANDLIKDFSNAFNSSILSLHVNALESENNAKSKLLAGILIKDISVTSKILFFLKHFKLYDNRIAFWIRNLVEARNSVAHGRRVHYEKAIFPVKPFFPLISNNLYPLEFLRILTAKAISSHIGISLYSKEWNEIKDCLIDDEFVTKVFLQEKFKDKEDLNNDEERIVFGGVNYHLLANKLKPESSIGFYKFYLDTEAENENFLASNAEALVILFETIREQNFEEALKSAIINIHRLDCNPHGRFRDLRYFLDFHNFKSPKLEILIANEVVR